MDPNKQTRKDMYPVVDVNLNQSLPQEQNMSCPYMNNCPFMLEATQKYGNIEENNQIRSPISVGVGPFHADFGHNYYQYPYYNYPYYDYPYYGYSYYHRPRPWWMY